MIKRAVPAVIGLFVLYSSLAAQPPADPGQATFTSDALRTTGALDPGAALSLYRPDIFNSVDGSVLIHSLPVLTLLDGRRFPVAGELGRMGMTPLNLFPLAFFSAIDVQKVRTSPMAGSNAPGGVVDLRLNRDYGTHGEMGVFYGKSGGKYGREDFQAYVVGGVGNDKIQITAGAAYQESSGRTVHPRH